MKKQRKEYFAVCNQKDSLGFIVASYYVSIFGSKKDCFQKMKVNEENLNRRTKEAFIFTSNTEL